MFNKHIFVVVLCVLLGFRPPPPAQAEPQLLQRVGEEAVQATLRGTTSAGNLLFACQDQPTEVGWEKLIRWSTVPPHPATRHALLVDGSRLALTESWTGEPAVQLDHQTVTAHTQLFGKISFPSTQLHTIWFRRRGRRGRRPMRATARAAVAAFLRATARETLARSRWSLVAPGRSKIMGGSDADYVEAVPGHAQAPPTTPDQDQLLLEDGDQLTGMCQEIGQAVWFQPDGAQQPIEFPLQRVTALILGKRAIALGAQNLHVGWHDGSLLVAEKFVVAAHQARLQLACGLDGITGPRSALCYLRSLRTNAVYLSDLPAAAYENVPYLEIPWACGRDHNVLGGPLTTQGRTYAKGLGLQTASRLTYDLPPQKQQAANPQTPGTWRYFKAQLGLDDAAGPGQGSVIYRVYLHQKNTWELAFSSPVLRGGDPPLEVSVELGNATQIALATEFADRGDERDYANWLDARLE